MTEKNGMRLEVCDNGRYLLKEGNPFFWLADTAWLIFEKIDEAEAELYLRNRKEKGFNVIQATLIHKWPERNKDGDTPLIQNDFMQIDETGAFWKRVETIVDIAASMDIYMALLPAWGSIVKKGYLNSENADHYLEFLIRHFGNKKNVIWLIGGDVKGEEAIDLFIHIGMRLKNECRDQLIGFHPFGRTSSSFWFHEMPWLDFNMFQSGHRRYDQVNLKAWDDNEGTPYYGEDNYKYVAHDLSLLPIKPTLDGEPSYEQIPQGLHDEKEPKWQSWDIRRYAYWSTFAGAFGHTYGSNAVMQFYTQTDKEGAYGITRSWQEEKDNIGSFCMGHLRKLMESVDFINGRAKEDLLVSANKEKYEHISVFAGDDFIFCYDYLGIPFTLDFSSYHGNMKFYYMDPLSGGYGYEGSVTGETKVRFSPPEKLEGHNDWVLVLLLEKQEIKTGRCS